MSDKNSTPRPRRVLSKGDIFNKNDLPIQWVLVPEWADGDEEAGVFVRTMTAAEKDALEASTVKMDNKTGKRSLNLANYRARLASLVICDEKSNPLFSEDDSNELGRKSPKALDRVITVAKELNGIDDEDLEEAKGN